MSARRKEKMPSLPEIARRGPLTLRQLREIETSILRRGNFSRERTRKEISWFCLKLGIADYYFKHTPVREIAKHIESFRATRIIAENSGGQPVNVQFINEQGAAATYMVEDKYEQVRIIKQRIEKQYPVFRLQSYRCLGYPLRFYNVSRPRFGRAAASRGGFTFKEAANRDFLANSPPVTIERYRRLWSELRGRNVPLIRFSELPEQGETRIMVGLEGEAAPGFFTNSTFILKKYQIHINRCYVEPFADGIVIFSFYLDRIADQKLRRRLCQDVDMAALLPRTALSELFISGDFSGQETMYAIAAANFAHQFLSTYTDEYVTLIRALEGKPELVGLLSVFKTHLAKDTYHEDRVNGVILKYRHIVKDLYAAFQERFSPGAGRRQHELYLKSAREKMELKVSSEISRHILKALADFNRAILKTNFFKAEKICLSFRLDPSFLNPVDYPRRPFGIFYLIGKGFRGFHIRFRDIARGGIRLVRSPTQADYDLNSDFIFDENYSLALTQQRKNKDIPEGGAKGTILLARDYQGKGEVIFRQYIDGLLDLLLLPHPQVVDHYGREEILFLGPDEGTAGLMNWAALHARDRGYRYWKAFTTGKKPELGGIPHDTYGMTTRGIRRYVEEILRVLNWKETRVKKIQTGGPDGDLGSNEILLSRDRTLGVADISGVLYDPRGLDREELKRLARKRLAAKRFNRKKLSPRGFFVRVQDRNITLPDGKVVANGAEFRNRFHFYQGLKADLFVPCGGRPRAINIGNWRDFFDQKSAPRARVIVEGANLFITQEARLRLEENGVILLKDATANKGGVTSSSLEVLAALVLDDEEFGETISVPAKGGVHPFRKKYIEEIIGIIRENARREFRVLWEEHKKTGRPLSLLSDLLSDKIDQIADEISKSRLYDNPELRRKIILRHCPPALVERVGFERIMSNVPEAYLKAVFASALASTYIYEKGLEASELDFFEFIEQS